MEKRRYKRWEVEKTAQCRFRENVLSCSLEDISFKGARIVFPAGPAAEEELRESLQLTITIAGELEPLNVVCDIAWQSRKEYQKMVTDW